MRCAFAAMASFTLVACGGKSMDSPSAADGSSASTVPEPACETGPGVTTLVSPSGQFAYDIVVDDQWVWYAASDGVHRVSHTGSDDEVVGAAQDAVSLALVGGEAWFFGDYLEGSGPKQQSAAALFAVSTDGGVPAIAVGGAWSMVLTTDGSSLFWPSGAGVNRLDPPSTAPQALFSASPAGIVQALAVDDSYVYVPSSDLTGTGGTIGRVAKSGGSLATIVGGQAQPCAIAVDDTSIYWVNSGHGEIWDGSYVPDALMSANKDGSGVTVLAGDTPTSQTRGIVAVAVDADYVFWIETVSGQVMKMPKKGAARNR
jgi:hypothetical protein